MDKKKSKVIVYKCNQEKYGIGYWIPILNTGAKHSHIICAQLLLICDICWNTTPSDCSLFVIKTKKYGYLLICFSCVKLKSFKNIIGLDTQKIILSHEQKILNSTNFKL